MKLTNKFNTHLYSCASDSFKTGILFDFLEDGFGLAGGVGGPGTVRIFMFWSHVRDVKSSDVGLLLDCSELDDAVGLFALIPV